MIMISLCGIISRVIFYQEDFGFGWVFFRVIFEFVSKVVYIYCCFMVGQFMGFMGCFVGYCCFVDFVDDYFGFSWVFFELFSQFFIYQVFNGWLNFGGYQFVFGLVGEFWIRYFN